MMPNLKIGVITITYNSAKVLEPFFKSVLNQTHTNFILYIIDNISSDNTLEIINQHKDNRIQLIKNTENFGVAKGNNQGINAALSNKCDLLLLLNNDVEFEYNLFEKLVRNLYTFNASLIAPKMMYHPETHLIWWAGTKFKKTDSNLTNHIGIQEKDTGQYNNIETMDYAPTACVLMKREVIEDVGMMDEKYFAYFDDADFFYRIYVHKKHKLIYYPDAKFYHKVGGLSNMREGSATQFKFNDFYIHLTIRNHVYYLRKQKTINSYWNIFKLFFRNNLRFLFSGKFHVNFKTFKLINRSYIEGLYL